MAKGPRVTAQAVIVAVAMLEVALVAGVAAYMAAADRALVVRFVPRDSLGGGAAAAGMVIPVAGVRADELRDSWGAARDGGRRPHRGIDIFAPRGTGVLAAGEGVVVRIDSAGAGGNAVWQRAADGRTVYYYAHLDAVRPGLKPGDLLRAGDAVGTVGSTGNVQGSPHLHFGVSTIPHPNRLAPRRDLNPFPLLTPDPGRAGADASP